MTLNRRLAHLEAAFIECRDVRRKVIIRDFLAWLDANLSKRERLAFDRIACNMAKQTDAALEQRGHTRDAWNKFLANLGPVTDEDIELEHAIAARIPPELTARMKAG